MTSYATAEWLPRHPNDHSHFAGKRRAEDDPDLESQSNISSHFKKLRLNHTAPQPQSLSSPSPQTLPPSTTTVPYRAQPGIASTSINAQPGTSLSTNPNTTRHDGRPIPLPLPQYAALSHPAPAPAPTQYPSSAFNLPSISDTDFMPIDETPHRVVISDLNAEIAQIEADEAAANSTVFLPDIDKKVSSIPSRVLRAAPSSPSQNLNSTALVLYREPSSITVPEEMDAVRKAIVAARVRAREKQAEELRNQQQQQRQEEPSPGLGATTVPEVDLDDIVPDEPVPVRDEVLDADEDADAMEIE